MFKDIIDKIKKSEDLFFLFKGVFWNLFGTLFYQGLMLLSSILIARILEKSEYGQLGIIRSTVNMFVVLSAFGIGLTATKYIAELKNTNREKVGEIIGMTNLFTLFSSILISLSIFLFAEVIANDLMQTPNLVKEIKFSSIILFFCTLSGTQNGILVGFESYKLIAKNNFIAALLTFPIQLILTWLYGLSGAIVSFGLGYFILWVLNFFTVKKVCEIENLVINYKNSWNQKNILYRFSLPAFFSGALVAPVMWLCNLFLIKNSSGFNEMALFDAANQWRNVILFIPAMVSRVALPLFSKHSNLHEKFSNILKFNVAINFLFTALICLVVYFFSSIIMGFYGQDFIVGKFVLTILCLSTVFSSVSAIIGQAIAGKDEMWKGFYFNLIWAIFLIGFSRYFIKSMGAEGLALSYLIAYFLHMLILIAYFNYSFKINILSFRKLKSLNNLS